MSADFCEARFGDVRCDEMWGTGEPDPHTFVAGKAQHWTAFDDGFFIVWHDDEPPQFGGPTAEGLAALGAGLRAIGEAWEASSVAVRFLLSALADPCADRIKVAPSVADVERGIAFMHRCGIPLDRLAYDPGPPARILCTPEPYPERIEIGPDVAALAAHPPVWYTPGMFVGDRWPFTDVPTHAGPEATCPLCHPEAP